MLAAAVSAAVVPAASVSSAVVSAASVSAAVVSAADVSVESPAYPAVAPAFLFILFTAFCNTEI